MHICAYVLAQISCSNNRWEFVGVRLRWCQSGMVLDCGGVNLGLRRLFNAWAYFVMYKAAILNGESSGSEGYAKNAFMQLLVMYCVVLFLS